MTYDPVPYWLTRGASYERRFVPARYAAQEAALVGVLDELEYDTVLEVGCGFGRIGALVKSLRPDVAYTGIDISPDLIQSARTRVPDGEFYGVTLSDFDPGGRTFDLVIAAEVLMHIPTRSVGRAIDKMHALSSRHIVTVDWTEPVERKVGPHNFLHDYRALGASVRVPVGAQTIHVVTK